MMNVGNSLLNVGSKNTLAQIGILSAAFAFGAVVSTTLLFSLTGLLSTSGNKSPRTAQSVSANSYAPNRESATKAAVPSDSINTHSDPKALVELLGEPKEAPAPGGEVQPPSITAPTESTKNIQVAPVEEDLFAIEVTAPVAKPKVEAPEIKDSNSITYKLVAGDTLTKIWTKNGGSMKSGLLAGKALSAANIPVNILKVGDGVELKKAADGSIASLTRKLKDGRILTIEGDAKTGYQANLTQSKVTEKEKKISGIITSSFSLAALDASVPYPVVDELVDLFSSRLEFRRDLQPGDTFTISYSARIGEDGTELEPGPISAASIENGGKILAAVRYLDEDGSARFYDEAGKALGNYFLRYPLKFSRISSVFSNARFHPVLGINRPHNGVDFAAPVGTPVRSVGDGVVVEAGFHRDAGYMVRIAHNDRYSTAYLHLSKIASGIKRGARVLKGDNLGSVGQTGLATGPHLHFSLYDRGNYVDPLKANLPTLSADESSIPAGVLQVKLDEIKQVHQQFAVALNFISKKLS